MTVCTAQFDAAEAHLFVEGALEPARRETFEEHLPGCPGCQGIVDDAHAMATLIQREVAEAPLAPARPETTVGLSGVRKRVLGSTGGVRSLDRGPRLLRLSPVLLAAAVVVLGVFLVFEGPPAPTLRAALLARAPLADWARGLETSHPGFFQEDQRGGAGDSSRLFAVPSRQYGDLAAALRVAEDGDRVLVADPSVLSTLQELDPWRAEDTSGDGEDDAIVWAGGRVELLTLGRTAGPLSDLLDAYATAAEVAGLPQEGARETSFLNVTLAAAANLGVLVLTPEGRLTGVPGFGSAGDWVPGRPGRQVVPAIEPVVERLDTGERIQASRLQPPAPLFLEDRSTMYVLEGGRIEVVPVHWETLPRGLELAPGSEVLLLASPVAFDVHRLVQRFHRRFPDAAGGAARNRALEELCDWIRNEQDGAQATRVEITAH